MTSTVLVSLIVASALLSLLTAALAVATVCLLFRQSKAATENHDNTANHIATCTDIVTRRLSHLREAVAADLEECRAFATLDFPVWCTITLLYRDYKTRRQRVDGRGAWVAPGGEHTFCLTPDRPIPEGAWILCHGDGFMVRVSVGNQLQTTNDARQSLCHIDEVQSGQFIRITIIANQSPRQHLKKALERKYLKTPVA